MVLRLALPFALVLGLAAVTSPAVASPPSPPPPRPSPPAKPPEHLRDARVISVTVRGAELIVKINRGSDHGVTTTWAATLLRGTTDEPLAGGEIKLLRVEPRTSTGTLRRTDASVNHNARVRFTPPAV